jgi:hypothetical protein
MKLPPKPNRKRTVPTTGRCDSRPALRLRLRVLLHRATLDRQLSDRRPAGAREDRALRARQLADVGTRRQLARSLRGLITDSELPATARLCSAVPVCRGAVLPWRQALLGLAERLERSEPVNPCGVARVRLLLTDGDSPVYDPYPARSMSEAIWWIADGLRPVQSHDGKHPAAARAHRQP